MKPLALRTAGLVGLLSLAAAFVTAAPAGAATTGVSYVQSGTVSTGSRVATATLKLKGAVGQGHLLVGWFGQYDTTGQVHVSDNVNGAWTRAGSELFTNNKGDLALYFKANAAASSGLTITLSADLPAYLLGTASEYAGASTNNVPEAVAIGRGTGATADSGLTGSVQAGDLVYGALLTGGDPHGFSMSSSQGIQFTKRASNVNGTAGSGDILSSAAGPQHAGFTLGSPTNWYAAAITFQAAAPITTTPSAGSQSETLTVPFRNGPAGATTTRSYSGTVTVQISGTGQAAGGQYSDAFYVYADAAGHVYMPPVHYNLLYDWTLWIDGGPADRVLTAIPAYESDHQYTFTLNAPGGHLTFGVGDTGTGDNTGQYQVTISQ